MAETPDLDTPFANDSERATCIAELLSLAAQLELKRDQASIAKPLPESNSVDAELQRWSSLFEAELEALFGARDRVVHGIRLGDRELRGAVWLAQQLLNVLDSASIRQS